MTRQGDRHLTRTPGLLILGGREVVLMHVTGMTISRIPPFARTVEFKFDERVNLFIGPNGSGKSTALRMLQARTTLGGRFDLQLSEDWQPSSATARGVSSARAQRITGRGASELTPKERSLSAVPWLYIPAVRLSLPLSNDHDTMHQLQATIPAIVRLSSEEFPANRPIETARNFLSQYHFDGSIVQKYCKEVTDLIRMRKSDSDDIERLLSAKKVAYKCAQSICSDILSSGHFPSDYVYHQDIGHNSTITNILDDMGVTLTHRKNGLIFTGDLSAGTQATLLWIWYMAIEMADFYQNREDWSTQPAILLIDEIENHLHPTWQRRVIPALLEHFPGLQIFATTHSPFVVAGLRSGQVHLLNRDADGVITASPNAEDIIGWTADEILRIFMGVEDPTDDATAAAARELRQLQDAGPHPDEGQEEQRQARMEELRQLVNRDLLAGSPRAAEEERFAENLARILEKYRLTKDLSQENG